MPNRPAPLAATVLEPVLQDSRRLRDIEHHYHLEMIAEDAEALGQFHSQVLHWKAAYAARNVQHFVQTARDRGNCHAEWDGLAHDMERMAQGIQRLAASPTAGGRPPRPGGEGGLNDAVFGLEATVLECFDRLTAQMQQNKVALDRIAESLRHPYESQAQELRGEATKWLLQGMRHTGRERHDDFADSMRLLRVCVDNPIGHQDYVAWFQIGWLLWRHEGRLPEAEEAFYHAQRFSGPSADLYHVKALRHFAHVQSLQGKCPQAYETLRRALDVSQDHDTCLDAACHAARAGCRDDALALLDQCITDRPVTLVTMFAEPDLAPLFPDLAALAARHRAEAGRRVEAGMEHWHTSLETFRDAGHRAGMQILLPLPLLVQITEVGSRMETADYLKTLGLIRQTQATIADAWSHALTVLAAEADTRVRAVEEHQYQAGQIQRQQRTQAEEAEQSWREMVSRLEAERRQALPLRPWPLLGAAQRQRADGDFTEKYRMAQTVHEQQRHHADEIARRRLAETQTRLRDAEGQQRQAAEALRFLQSAHKAIPLAA